mmetsp:Transcript_35795/g.89813  ORF Transcript_35795/g.89813 Transcript_35795/m.89813 type:complete len:215 (-) Transcript_35795:31-675(-)
MGDMPAGTCGGAGAFPPPADSSAPNSKPKWFGGEKGMPGKGGEGGSSMLRGGGGPQPGGPKSAGGAACGGGGGGGGGAVGGGDVSDSDRTLFSSCIFFCSSCSLRFSASLSTRFSCWNSVCFCPCNASSRRSSFCTVSARSSSSGSSCRLQPPPASSFTSTAASVPASFNPSAPPSPSAPARWAASCRTCRALRRCIHALYTARRTGCSGGFTT